MRMPSSVAEIYRDKVYLSWHAGIRLCERGGFSPTESLTRVADGLANSGVIMGGQKGNDVLVRATLRGTDEELALVFSKVGRVWVIRTVLTMDQAMANMQARSNRKYV